MAQPRCPNMRELAAKLGVSTTTVSLALRSDPRIPLATREKVQAVAQEMGYRTNALVNALMSQVRQSSRLTPTGEVVTYLTSFDTSDFWKDVPSMSAQFEGARERAAELGFKMEVMWLGNRARQSQHTARVLASRGIRGSILAPLPVDHQTLELDWNAHTVIAIGYSFGQAAVNRAVHHNINAALACYENLRKLGYERIGLAIHELDDARVHGLWTCGYLGSQRLHGGTALPPMYISDYKDSNPFFEWLEAHRPDAIIGIWNHTPLHWLAKAGIDVPGQIGFASLDIGDNQVGQIAGILQDNHNVGVAAMDTLAGQLFRNEIGIPRVPKFTMIEGTWMYGKTVMRRNSA